MSCLDGSCEMKMPRRSGTLDRPTSPSSTPSTGRIVRLLIGQAYGFIRARNGRAIFFIAPICATRRPSTRCGSAIWSRSSWLTISSAARARSVSPRRAVHVSDDSVAWIARVRLASLPRALQQSMSLRTLRRSRHGAHARTTSFPPREPARPSERCPPRRG